MSCPRLTRATDVHIHQCLSQTVSGCEDDRKGRLTRGLKDKDGAGRRSQSMN